MFGNKLIAGVKKILRNVPFLQKPYSKWKIARIRKQSNKALHAQGYKVLQEIMNELNKTDMKVFCAFGTLLGIVRDGGFIASDEDIDMGIIQNESFAWEKLERILAGCNMHKVRQFVLDGQITEQTYAKNGVVVDFFLYYRTGDRLTANVYWIDPSKKYKHPNGHSVTYRDCPIIDNIIEWETHGIKVPVPENNVAYLEASYGRGWKVPDPNFRYENFVRTIDDIESYKVDFGGKA